MVRARLLLVLLPLAALHAEEQILEETPAPEAIPVPPAEPVPTPPPAPTAPPTPSLGQLRQQWEGIFGTLGWKMAMKEDSYLLVCSPEEKLATDIKVAATEAMELFCKILKTDPETLRGREKFGFIVTVSRDEYMRFGNFWAEQAKDPMIVKRFEKASANGNVVCADPARGAGPVGSQNLACHIMGHMMLNRYANRIQKDVKIPAWVLEGLPAYLEGEIRKGPHISCMAEVGYDDKDLKERGPKGGWEATVRKVVEEYKEKTKKKELMETYRGLAQLTARPFEKLSGHEVAVAWAVNKDLIENQPAKYKAFLDAVFGGTKQLDAFETAFGESVDEYEKDWMKKVLKTASTEDKKPRKK